MERPDDQGGSLIREGVKRAIAAGTAAIFMTEEGVRHLVGDMKLPKDIVRYVTEQAAEGRTEFFTMLRTEIRRFFDRYEPNVELRKLLAENAIDVTARIRFVPDDGGRLAPDVVHGTAQAVGPDTGPPKKKKKKQQQVRKKKAPRKKKAKTRSQKKKTTERKPAKRNTAKRKTTKRQATKRKSAKKRKKRR